MNEFDNHTSDTPPGWDRYAELLRRQPEAAMSRDAQLRMMPRIDAAIEQRGRHNRVLRWTLVPTLSAAALVAVMIVEMVPSKTLQPPPPHVAPAIVQNTTVRPRAARRIAHKRLPPSSVTFEYEQEPMVVESQPIVREQVAVPREVPVGPGPGPSHTPKPSTPEH